MQIIIPILIQGQGFLLQATLAWTIIIFCFYAMSVNVDTKLFDKFSADILI